MGCADWRIDLSPKGDPPDLVQAPDEITLAMPDRLRNRGAKYLRQQERCPLSWTKSPYDRSGRLGARFG